MYYFLEGWQSVPPLFWSLVGGYLMIGALKSICDLALYRITPEKLRTERKYSRQPLSSRQYFFSRLVSLLVAVAIMSVCPLLLPPPVSTLSQVPLLFQIAAGAFLFLELVRVPIEAWVSSQNLFQSAHFQDIVQWTPQTSRKFRQRLLIARFAQKITIIPWVLLGLLFVPSSLSAWSNSSFWLWFWLNHLFRELAE